MGLSDDTCVQSCEITIVWEEAKETETEGFESNSTRVRRREEEKKGYLEDETENESQDEETKYKSIPPVSDVIKKSLIRIRTIRKLMKIPWKSLPFPLMMNPKRMPQRIV